jgi:aryl-alcohol dehydrogenase-like predicted oxidoreductase
MMGAMEERKLGSSGLGVSALGLGTNNFGSRLDEAGARAVLEAALDIGVTFIDTSDSYGFGRSEELIGALLGPHRDEVAIATKFGSPMGDAAYRRGGSRRWIREAVEGSLRRLRTDRIDLYQMHWMDPATPIQETLEALDDLVRAGKVLYVGTCNYGAWQLVNAQWTARAADLRVPISAQHHYNLLQRDIQADVLPAARTLGLGLIPYFPLASGFLTGKYRPGRTPPGRLTEHRRAAETLTEENFARLQRFDTFAGQRDHDVLDLAVAWLLSQPEVGSVIASASSPEQVRRNASAAIWRLDAAEMEEVASI